MKLRLIASLSLILLLAPVVAESQTPTKAAKIGWMSGGNPTVTDPTMNALCQGMRELGYVEGRPSSWSRGMPPAK